MKLKTQWLLLALFAALPYLVLGAAGAWWLYDSGWWLWWIAWAALVSLSGWPLLAWLRKRTRLPGSSAARPSAALDDVDPGVVALAIAKAHERKSPPMEFLPGAELGLSAGSLVVVTAAFKAPSRTQQGVAERVKRWLHGFLTEGGGSAALGMGGVSMVGVRGFEPPTPTSRTWCSTRLSYTPHRRRGAL